MIKFENVRKSLGGKLVLDGVDFEIERGETFVIVGASGAGKSVSLKHMIRLMQPDSGRVVIGEDVISEAEGHELEQIRGRFGMLFQGAALLQWMDVAANVALPLHEHSRKSEAEIEQLVAEKLELVGLDGAGHKMPADISGGMRKRVGLARAIITEPEIVLYDEPTSGLDPVTSRKIDDLINDLRKRLGVTSVVVTHDLHSALSIASRIGVISGGKMVEVSAPQDFIKSKNKVVESFLESQYITRRGRWEGDMQQ
jgi:phospholipid/cholesterol/gamma-HCH transport system ATP-binding protein